MASKKPPAVVNAFAALAATVAKTTPKPAKPRPGPSPLLVRYAPAGSTVPARPGQVIISRLDMSVGALQDLEDWIVEEEVTSVVLAGPSIITGWFIKIARPVKFEFTPGLRSFDKLYAEEQQASNRIRSTL